MVDATRSSEPGRELAALGRADVPAAMLEASAPVRRREANGLRCPAWPGDAGRERPRPVRSRSRAREIVASTILMREAERDRDDGLDVLEPRGGVVDPVVADVGRVARRDLVDAEGGALDRAEAGAESVRDRLGAVLRVPDRALERRVLRDLELGREVLDRRDGDG